MDGDETYLASSGLIPETGSLSVSSNPAGAHIWLNGEKRSELTDTTITGLSPGRYSVKVSLDGYDTAEGWIVRVVAGGTTSISFDLVHEVGSLSVSSNPMGACIWLDGVKKFGLTNTTLIGISSGQHNVTVALDGYETPAERTVTVFGDKTAFVSFDLLRETGSLSVSSSPAGAQIWLDGTDAGTTTNTTLYDLLPGDHQVKVALDGYVTPAEQTVTVVAGETAPVFFDLAPETGSLSVSSSPAGAQIWLDGDDTGTTTNTTLYDLLPGDHQVKVALDGYVTPAEQTVTVVAGETASIFFALDPDSTPTPTPPPPESSSYSSRGGRSSTSAGAASDLPAGGHATFKVRDSAIYEVRVKTAEPVSDLLITIEKTTKSNKIEAPLEAVYEYDEIRLYHTHDDALARVVLDFTVTKAWLEEQGVDPESVTMYRYHDGSWHALPTSIIDENEYRYFFTARSTGFSLFAIGAEASGFAQVTFSAESEVSSPVTTPTQTTTMPSTPSTAPTPTQSSVPYELATLAAGAALLLRGRRG